MKNYLKKGLALILILTMAVSLAACGIIRDIADVDINNSDVNSVDIDSGVVGNGDGGELALALREKYAASEPVEYEESLGWVSPDHVFEFEVEFDTWDYKYYEEKPFVVYADNDFTIEVDSNLKLDRDDNGHGVFSVMPSTYSSSSVENAYRPDRSGTFLWFETEKIFESQGDILFEKEQNQDWGNLPQYYLVQDIDLKTGEKLDKPIVRVFSIEKELKAPLNLSFTIEEGLATFTWDEVPGAENYLVVGLMVANKDDGTKKLEGFFQKPSSQTLGYVDQTYWQDRISDDDLSPLMNQTMFFTGGSDSHEYAYAVVAINSDGMSPMSRMYWAKDILPLLPHNADYFSEDYKYQVDSINQLPSHLPIEMCDKSPASYVIDYDMDNHEALLGNLDGTSYLQIYYNLPGTPYKGKMSVLKVQESTYKEELAKIKARQDELLNTGGLVKPEIKVEDDDATPDDTPDTTQAAVTEPAVTEPDTTTEPAVDITEPPVETTEQSSQGTNDPDPDLSVPGDVIFASNALSEYFAINMMNVNDRIPLSGFPEASDQEYLFDAFQEAYYQNPLCAPWSEIRYFPGTNELGVEYKYGKDDWIQKQDGIRQKVSEVNAQIITAGMSDYDKSIAINDYLCDQAVYDYDALDDAAKSNYQSYDPKYEDSFNAYGILVKGVGVCASYAACYKLLADAAGLDAVVVVGVVNGNMGHAWNRAFVDGEWKTVDTTWNDDENIPNAFLHISDAAVELTRVEGNEYVMDSELYKYTSTQDDKEFYRVQGNYFAKSEIADKLVDAALDNNGKAVLRTDYDLSQDDGSKIMESIKSNPKLSSSKYTGFFVDERLGAIYIEFSE